MWKYGMTVLIVLYSFLKYGTKHWSEIINTNVCNKSMYCLAHSWNLKHPVQFICETQKNTCTKISTFTVCSFLQCSSDQQSLSNPLISQLMLNAIQILASEVGRVNIMNTAPSEQSLQLGYRELLFWFCQKMCFFFSVNFIFMQLFQDFVFLVSQLFVYCNSLLRVISKI